MKINLINNNKYIYIYIYIYIYKSLGSVVASANQRVECQLLFVLLVDEDEVRPSGKDTEQVVVSVRVKQGGCVARAHHQLRLFQVAHHTALQTSRQLREGSRGVTWRSRGVAAST